jgi:MFS family permease
MSTLNTQNLSVTSQPTERVAWKRLWLIGLFTILASTIVNIIIATLAISLLSVPSTSDLQLPVYSIATVVGALGAVLVFALINRLSRRPFQLYRIIATIVLLFTFIPDIQLLYTPGYSPSAVVLLSVMHLTTYLITVGMLTTLTQAR